MEGVNYKKGQDMMNVLFLCSGSDRAFFDAGYIYPKNLVEISGKPLIQNVFESFRELMGVQNKIFVTLKKEECCRWHTATVVQLLIKNSHVIQIPQETMGAACTALLASNHISDEEPLLIINGDIILKCSVIPAIQKFEALNADGGAVTFDSVHPKWSYVRCSECGEVVEATEKRPISRIATAGIYYYKKAGDFFEGAKQSIRKDARVDGKFYICPVFNEMILQQKKIFIYQVNSSTYHSLSTLEGIKRYQDYLREEEKNDKYCSANGR